MENLLSPPQQVYKEGANGQILAASIAVMDNTFGLAACPQCLLKCIQNQICLHMLKYPPANDVAGENVNHKRDIHKPRPGRHIGNIGNPELVWMEG